jgi:hypothetical protein
LKKEIWMGQNVFNDKDLRQISNHGLTVSAVQKHLDMFKMPPPYLDLLAPCTPGDGIKVIDQGKIQELTETYEQEAKKGRCLKFVPGSGAASRMFKTLLKFQNRETEILREAIVREAQAGKEEAKELLEFINGTKRFAFFKDLNSVMSENRFDLDTLVGKGQFSDIVRFLVSEIGLNYARSAKGLLKFHEYPEGSRTAFEEHLVEAAYYVKDEKGQCPLHFTVSQSHLEKFRNLLKRVKPVYEKKYRVSFNVTFSMQKKFTDTLAVDLDNRPFRDKDNRLLFRPGGHGALIENLNDLKADIVFIKNIDNVASDRFKPETVKWKKILGGYLMAIQNQIFNYMEKLSSKTVNRTLLEQVKNFVKEELLLTRPSFLKDASIDDQKTVLMEKLNRPVRVCGMVRNVKEPGGGPFWVKDQTGERSLQIVEKAQIDPGSREQRAILAASSHFNPVDLVCGVRDRQGRPFDLLKFVDPNAVLISKKSKEGKDLKALEHPGLWNGAMARWITIFVEVPGITFNPVKTVNDLLRQAHQAS